LTLQFSPFVALFLLTGTVTLVFTILGWGNRRVRIALPFTLLMGALTVWIYGYTLEILTPDLGTSLFFNHIEIPAMHTVPVAFLMIALYYTGHGRYVTTRTLPLFFLGTVTFSLLEFTNPLHYLYYPGFYPVTYDGAVIWGHAHGPFFWLAIAYTYGFSILALVLIVSHIFATGTHMRRPLALMLVAAGIPVVVNLISVFGLAPFPAVDKTPIAFMITGILLAFGLFRSLFSAVPVAYSRVIATMPDGVIITNGPTRVIDQNPAAEEITGVRLGDAIGREIADLLPALTPVLAGPDLPEEGMRTECTIPQEGRQPRIFDVIAMPLGERGTGAGGGLFVLRDVTERRRAELALAESNRKLNLLTGITRHDLSNKLQVAVLAHDLLRSEITDEVQAEHLAQLERALNAMIEQIEFTQDYEQLGAESPSWQMIDALVRRAWGQAGSRAVTLSSSVDQLEVCADAMLEKVFYNLFDNALNYGGEGMHAIVVSSHPDGTDLVVVVEDDGAGIPAADKDRLFERGFGQHTGLGLFLSREILSITGIAIAETGEPGGGARFEIRVPAGRFRHAAAREPQGYRGRRSGPSRFVDDYGSTPRSPVE